jgi:hypothetical protein
MREISRRALKMVAVAVSVVGRSSSRKTGGRTTLVHLMRRSSVGWNIGPFLGLVSYECAARPAQAAAEDGQVLGNDLTACCVRDGQARVRDYFGNWLA